MRYVWGLILWKMLKKGTAKVQLGSYIVENAKLNNNWVFFFPFKMQK